MRVKTAGNHFDGLSQITHNYFKLDDLKLKRVFFFSMAYLKKHAIVHQYSVSEVEKRLGLQEYSALISNKDASQVAAQFKTMLPDMEQHHLHQIRELYYQQRECLSAFQFVQHQTIGKSIKK